MSEPSATSPQAPSPESSRSPQAQISETNPRSLDELFDRDPLQLTREDRAEIIARLRADRERWAQAEAMSKPKRGKKAEARIAAGGQPLTLDDILGDIQE